MILVASSAAFIGANFVLNAPQHGRPEQKDQHRRHVPASAKRFAKVSVSAGHVAHRLTFEPLYQDPFDRLLKVQAICESPRLLTASKAVALYASPNDLMEQL